MKRTLLLGLAAGAAIGILIFLIRMTQSVDADLHLERLARIRAVDNLDLQLNRLVTLSRYTSIAAASNDRTDISRRLGDELDAMGKGPRSLRGLSKELNEAFDSYRTLIEDKFGIAFDFEARNTVSNQRLIASLDAVPAFAGDVLAVSNAAARDELNGVLNQLKSEVSTYAVTPTPTNESEIRDQLVAADRIAETQSQAFKDAVQRLHNSVDQVLADKNDLIAKLNEFLGTPTGPQLQKVEAAYLAWHEGQVAAANRYRLVLAGYAIFLLLVLAYLGNSLRRSYQDLDHANTELEKANQNLEGQVEERTKDLRKAMQDLRDSEAQLVQSEKMASLGQMVAGVAHEINTPLGYARANATIVRDSLAEVKNLCVAQDRALAMLTSEGASDEDIAQALTEARERNENVKMEELAGDLDGLLADSEHGLLQIAELVASLKDFSRVDRSKADMFSVNDGLESALKICQNHLKYRVEVVKNYGDLPQIECAPSQINQVFLNLITNAAQAIDGNGQIFLHTTTEKDGVGIRIIDTGHGMSEDVRAKIFDPFFTTKPVGKGTGLGLTIVYRIIQEHGGRIDVRSKQGKGTEFIIHLPIKQKRRAEAEPEMATAAA